MTYIREFLQFANNMCWHNERKRRALQLSMLGIWPGLSATLEKHGPRLVRVAKWQKCTMFHLLYHEKLITATFRAVYFFVLIPAPLDPFLKNAHYLFVALALAKTLSLD